MLSKHYDKKVLIMINNTSCCLLKSEHLNNVAKDNYQLLPALMSKRNFSHHPYKTKHLGKGVKISASLNQI